MATKERSIMLYVAAITDSYENDCAMNQQHCIIVLLLLLSKKLEVFRFTSTLCVLYFP